MTIFLTLFIGYAFYAYNRKSVSLVLPKLIEEGFDKSELGSIISSQNVAYAISKFVGGILSDKFSAKLLFSSGLIVSGLTTLVFANSSSAAVFSFLWFLNGLAQGCGWPACAKLLKKWFTPKHFGTLWSTLSASANISGGVSPFIATALTLQYGWRFSLLVAGTVSVAFGLLSFFTVSDSPSSKVSDTPQESQEHVKGKQKDHGTTSDDKNGTLASLIRSPFLWLVSVAYLVVFCAKTSAVDWGQLYLIEDRKQSQYAASAFTSSVESGGFFGGVLAGYLTDWVVKKRSPEQISSDKGNLRMDVAVYFMAGVVGFLHLLQFNVNETSSQFWIATLGFMLGVCFYGPIAIYGVVASENSPAHLSGTAHAIVALAANVGAIISGLPFSYIATFYNWSAIFFILEILSGVMVVVMLLCRNMRSSMGKVKKE